MKLYISGRALPPLQILKAFFLKQPPKRGKFQKSEIWSTWMRSLGPTPAEELR